MRALLDDKRCPICRTNCDTAGVYCVSPATAAQHAPPLVGVVLGVHQLRSTVAHVAQIVLHLAVEPDRKSR